MNNLLLRPDPHALRLLTTLRKQAGVTLAQMALACGLTGRRAHESASAWERGQAIPHARLRPSFIDYLAITLGLKKDLRRLEQTWEVLVEQWGWEPLTSAEVRRLQVDASVGSDSTPLPSLHGAHQAPIAALPPGSRMHFSYNPLFVGREPELAALAAILLDPQASAGGLIPAVAIVGMGGLGKTQLGIAFAYRYARSFPGGIFWLSFAQPEAIGAEVAACGGREYLALQPGFEQLTVAEQIRLVRAAWEEDATRLLIFDNCEDAALPAAWLPKAGGSRVLITSRRRSWQHATAVHSLPLSLFERVDSLALLRKHRPDSAVDDRALIGIAAELGDLPLALHVAGNYLARLGAGLDLTAYLHELQGMPGSTKGLLEDLEHPSLTSDFPSPTGHVQQITRTFALSYGQLDPAVPTDRYAQILLSCAAYFAPGEHLSEQLLTNTVTEMEQDDRASVSLVLAQSALQRLSDLGLIERYETGQQIWYRLHRLLAAFVRQQAGASTAQHRVELTLLRYTQGRNQHDDHPALLAIQAHLRVVTDAALARESAMAADLASAISWHLHQVSTTAETLHYNQRSLELREKQLGPQSPALAENFHTIGWTYDAEGLWESAYTYHERGLALRQRVLGHTHLDTASSLNYVGMVLHSLCRYGLARQRYNEALTILEQHAPREHPKRAEVLNNIGLLLNAQGRYQEALVFLKQALELRESSTSANESLLSVTINNLGYTLRGMGAYEQARAYLERALSMRDRIFGPQNAYTAVTLSHLGRLEHKIANYAAAQHYLERAMAIREQAYQPLHPDRFSSLTNLGMLAHDRGAYQEARGYLKEAVAMHRQVCGEQHRHTARSLNCLALVYTALGDAARAEESFRAALAIRAHVLGLSHHDTANTQCLLGRLLLRRGNYVEAQLLITQALVTHRAQLGEAHPSTARSLCAFAELWLPVDRAQAHQSATQALAIYEASLGEDHPWVALALDLLATIAMKGTQLDSARHILTRSLDIRVTRLGEEHPLTQQSQRSLLALSK